MVDAASTLFPPFILPRMMIRLDVGNGDIVDSCTQTDSPQLLSREDGDSDSVWERKKALMLWMERHSDRRMECEMPDAHVVPMYHGDDEVSKAVGELVGIGVRVAYDLSRRVAFVDEEDCVAVAWMEAVADPHSRRVNSIFNTRNIPDFWMPPTDESVILAWKSDGENRFKKKQIFRKGYSALEELRQQVRDLDMKASAGFARTSKFWGKTWAELVNRHGAYALDAESYDTPKFEKLAALAYAKMREVMDLVKPFALYDLRRGGGTLTGEKYEPDTQCRKRQKH